MPADSSKPDFWDTRFQDGVTPWDAGGVPPRLSVYVQKKPPLRVLVPGCGSGYEVRLFAERGHDVLAIDFSAEAVRAARRVLGPLAERVQQADFFSLREAPFDLVYERAFLCALPRARWPDWGRRMSELVRGGGHLVGYFYLDDNLRGPPFGTCQEDLRALLEPAFELAASEPVPPVESIPVFRGKEIWQVWKRRL